MLRQSRTSFPSSDWLEECRHCPRWDPSALPTRMCVCVTVCVSVCVCVREREREREFKVCVCAISVQCTVSTKRWHDLIS